MIEDALERYLDRQDHEWGLGHEETFGEIPDGVANWQRKHGVEPLSEEDAVTLTVKDQHAYRRGT